MTPARPLVATALLASLVCAAAVTGCSSTGAASGSGQPAVSVVASTNVYGDIVRRVVGRLAGSRVRVVSIINGPAADPHSYEATVRDQLELSRAAVVVRNGGGYDDFVDTMLRGASGRRTVIDAVQVSGKARAAGADLNEHVWYDVPTVARLARAIAAALGAADPADAPTFRANAGVVAGSIARLEATEASLRRAHAGAGVAITEPLPLYLLAACGLRNRTPPAFSAAVEDDRDVAASVLRQMLVRFARHEVRLLVYNAQTSGPETTRVLAAAQAAHVPVVPVTETLPAGGNYLSWMRATLAAVSAALR